MNRGRYRAPRARHYGQAVTEFLVLCLALIPLFLLTPMIAKYFDIAHATQMASRYLALQVVARHDPGSTWQDDAELAGEVRRRFFSNSDAPVKAGDTPGDFAAHRNPFWVDTAGRPLIEKFDRDVTLSFGAAGTAVQAEGFDPADDDAPFDLPAVRQVKDALDLQANGIYTAHVAVALANLPAGLKSLEPFDKIDLSIRRHTSMVIDPWGAENPSRVEERIDATAIFPGRVLRGANPLNGTVVTVLELGQVERPRTAELSLWRDLVPADRRP